MDGREGDGGQLLRVAILAVIAVGVGLILNASMGGELGHTIIRYAVYIGAGTATQFLGFLVFFA